MSNHSNFKTNSTLLKLVNENLLYRPCVRRKQQMHGYHPLNLLYY